MDKSKHRPGESGSKTDLSNVMAEEKGNRAAHNLSGSAFETICRGYDAETTLSLTFSIDSMDRRRKSEPVMIAKHIEWYLCIRRKMIDDKSYLAAFVCCDDVKKYPMTYFLDFTLEAKNASDRVTTMPVVRSYDGPSFGCFGQQLMPCDTLLNLRDKFEVDGKVTLTAKLIVSVPTCYNFNVANSFSDVTINVGDVSFPFNKAALAMHSSFFNAMFFGSFKESGEDVVTLKDVKLLAFVNLINVLFVRTFQLKKNSVASVLNLADRFDIVSVVDYCKQLLMKSKRKSRRPLEIDNPPSGSSFETICPGYNAEATLSVSFSVSSMKSQEKSEPVLVGNHLKWYMYVSRVDGGDQDYLEVITSSPDLNKYPMSCEVEFALEANNKSDRITSAVQRTYDEPTFGKCGYLPISFNALLNDREKFEVDGKVTVTAKLKISMPMCFNFNAVNSFSDVAIKIDQDSFVFSKAALAVHSTFFNALFFGSFQESSQDAVTLEDVDRLAFLKLINILFVRTFELKMNSVVSVLELAHRFGMLAIVEHCEELLMKCELYSEPCLAERLLLATKFSLNGLQKRCLELCKSAKVIREVVDSPFYKDLSSDGKVLLLERGMEFLPMNDDYGYKQFCR